MTKLSIAAFLLVLSVSYGLTKADLTMEQKLSELRVEMAQRGYSAYIILTDDEHQSEYTAEYDRRRAWISGFTGSAGTAVVTMSKAALWTDSRYYAQADIQLDKNYWMLMKASERDTPKIDEWLGTELTSGETVGLMAKFTPIDTWKSYENGLNHHGITLIDAETDLIDRIWTPDQGRPSKPNSKIFIYDIAFAGLSWEDKVDQIKTKMTSEGADLFVVSALDEVAWVLNMRGADVPNNPFFFAYLILRKNGPHTIYIENNRLDDELKHHLNGVQVKDYNSVESDIKAASDSGSSIWLSPVSSYAIYNAVSNKDEDKFIMKASPIRSIKARKNSVELRNLRTCHIRDSVARIRHMYWVETELEKGTEITEKSSADMLKSIQAQDPHYVSSSFGSISAVGKNAAIIHYSTAEGDNSKLTKNHIYLLDAGAQYLDCSTDITRTHHYGTPTQEEINAYTLTLQGATNLASLVFPQGVQGRDLDVEARKPFWQIGEDFGHGTGHGIGYFLSIHESPPTTNYASRSVYNEGFDAGMVQSDEPGFYVDGSFGIRLETDIESVETKTEYPYGTRQYLKFEPLNYVPFEKNLINECMLTNEQVDWLNKYNKDIREKVGLRLFDYPEVRKFMIKKTEPFLYAHQHKKCQKKSKWSLF